MFTHTPAIEPTTPKENKVDKMYALAQRIAMGEGGEWFLYCLQDGHFYAYRDNYWQTLDWLEVLSSISGAMPQINKHTMAAKKQILEHLKQVLFKHLTLFNKHDLINFKEGMFDVINEKLLDHNPDYFSTIRIPYSYNFNAVCPLWLKTLDEIFEGNKEKISTLQEFFGYCITRDTTQRKALLLLGESNCGKSTILNVLRFLVGEFNAASVPLKQLSNPQYTPSLINKLISVDPDVSADAKEFEADFKIIASGEPVQCNQKFIASFSFIPYCKIVMAANSFPRITDHSSAVYNRLILLPCDRIFHEKEQDKNLVFKLKEEMPGVFNWAVEGLHRLKERGHFDISNFMQEAVEDLREESNPIEGFFRENIAVDVGGEAKIYKQEAYELYIEWCKRNGNGTLSAIKFNKLFYSKYSRYTPNKSQCFNTGKRIWKNLRLINPNGHLDTLKEKEIQWQE